MRMNPIFKKVVALTCVITMLFSAIQLTVFAGSNLTSITMKDFGVNEGLYGYNDGAAAIEATYKDGNSLLGTKLVQKLTFSEHAGNRITYASLTEKPWVGIVIRTEASGGFSIINNVPDTSKESYSISAADFDGEALWGVEREWEIELKEDATTPGDVLLGISIDGTKNKSGYLRFAGLADKLGNRMNIEIANADGIIQVGTPVEVPDNLTPITMKNFGVNDGLYKYNDGVAAIEATYKDGNSLLGTKLVQKLTFSEHAGNRITYASLTEKPWVGIVIRTEASGGFSIINNVSDTSKESYSISAEDFEGKALWGVEREWEIELIEDTTTPGDVLLGISIDGTKNKSGYLRFAGLADKLGNRMNIEIGNADGIIQVGTPVEAPDNLTPITMKDFGVNEGLYGYNDGAAAIEATYKDGNSLLGTKLVQKLTFSEHAGNRITYASLTEKPWVGIVIRTEASGGFSIINNVPDTSKESYSISAADFDGEALWGVEREWEIELIEDAATPGDVLLGISIDGTKNKNGYLRFASLADKLGNRMNIEIVNTAGTIQVGTPVEVPDNLTPITMQDFGVADGLYKYNDGVAAIEATYKDGNSLLWTKLVQKLTFSEHAGNRITYASLTEKPWVGIVIRTESSGGFSIINNVPETSQESYSISAADFDGEALWGVEREWEIELIEDATTPGDVLLGISIGGTKNKSGYLRFVGLADKLGNRMNIEIGNTAGTIQVGTPVEAPDNLTPITMQDFGIEDGLYKYNNGAGAAYGSYHGGDSLIGTVFTETLSFSETGYNRIYYASMTDKTWVGIMIRVHPNGNITIQNKIPDSGQEIYELDAADIGVAKLHGVELEWKLELFADPSNADNALLGLSIDGQLCGDRYFSFANGVNILGTSAQVECEEAKSSIRVGAQVHTADEPANYTMKDFYIDNALYEYQDGGLSVYGLYNGSLINSVLTSNITFSEHENNILRYGISKSVPDKGICIKSNAAGEFEVYSDREGVTSGTYTITPESVQEEKLLGVDLEWQFKLFSDPDNAENVRLYIYINGKLWNDTYMSFTGGSQLGSGISIGIEHTEGTVRIGCLIAPPADITAITMKNFGVRDDLYKYMDGVAAVEATYRDSDTLIGTVLTQKMIISEHAYNRITYASLKEKPWVGIVIRTEASGNLAVINRVPGSNQETYTITPEDAGVEKFSGVELEWKIVLFADPNNKADACLGIYINETLCGNRYMTFANGVNIFGNSMNIEIGDENGSIQVGDLEAAPTIDKSFTQLRFCSYGIMSGVYTYNNDDLAASGTCDLESLDRVVFSDVVNFSKERGVSWFFGSKISEWRGMTWSVTKDGDLVVKERAFDRPDDDAVPFSDLVFESEIAGVELVGRDVEITLSFEYVDSDFDGEKDDVKLGVWFDGKAYNDKWIYLKNTAKYLGSYIGVFSSNKDASMGIKTTYIPIDFKEFGFTSNWYAELGFKK